jgi:protein-S-isoprenylcysteine O-methyltransferase Ste14
LWPRILIEESTLKRDLDGYADYMRRVKHRIIPGLL